MIAMTPYRETLIAEPVLQFPNAQCGKPLARVKRSLVSICAVFDFPSPSPFMKGSIFLGRSRPSAKTPPYPLPRMPRDFAMNLEIALKRCLSEG